MFRALAVIVGILVGCTACSAAGTDAPEATSQPAPTSTTRPRDIDLHGIDPCSLLDPAGRDVPGYVPPYRSVTPSDLYSGQVAGCTTIDSTPARAVGINVTLVTTTGIERFADPTLRVRAVPARTSGFPALILYPQGPTDYCSVVIDTSPGQLIEIEYSDVRQAPPIPQDDLCQGSLQAAETAIGALLGP